MSRRRYWCALIPALVPWTLAACGNDGVSTDTLVSSTTDDSTTVGSLTMPGSSSGSSTTMEFATGPTMSSTGGDNGLVVRVADNAGFDWCAANFFPVHGPENLASLFGAKYRIAFEPGAYVPGADQEIPFRFEVRGEERAVMSAEVDGSGFDVEPGTINPDQYGPVTDPDSDSRLVRLAQGFEIDPALGPEPWWDGKSAPPWLALVDIAVKPGRLEPNGGEVLLAPASGFVTRVVAYNTWFDPCSLSEVAADRTTVVVENGEVSFETRKLTWTISSGFAVRASGSVEGLVLDTSKYTDVTYTENTPIYMTQPTFAARLDQPGPKGECAFVVWVFASDPGDPVEPEAWFVDCDHQLLRQVDVLDIWTDFAPAQAGLPWDPRAGTRLSLME